MAFWDVPIFSVLARLQRNGDEIARNGVLGRYDFFGPSLAKTKRRGKPRSAIGAQLSNVMIDFLALPYKTSSQKRRRS